MRAKLDRISIHDRVKQQLPRTTNSVEGWHFRMNDFLSGSHPSLYKCIEMLKKEELHWDIQCQSLDIGHVPRRRKKYQLLNERIANVMDCYNTTTANRFEFLKNMSMCLKMD
jgi:hypothetical protein